jgi:uncharacterized protein YfeS
MKEFTEPLYRALLAAKVPMDLAQATVDGYVSQQLKEAAIRAEANTSSFNRDVLHEVIEVVESHFQLYRLEMMPKKKADLILAMYDCRLREGGMGEAKSLLERATPRG